MSKFECSRCGEHKLEIMKSYAFCWECGYSPTTEETKDNFSWAAINTVPKKMPVSAMAAKKAVL